MTEALRSKRPWNSCMARAVNLHSEISELLAEGWLLEPTVEGSFRNAGIAGGLGYGRRSGDDGDGRLLSAGEAGEI